MRCEKAVSKKYIGREENGKEWARPGSECNSADTTENVQFYIT